MRNKLLITVGILFVIIISGFYWISPPKFIQQFGLPEIARDLPRSFKDADVEFGKRVKSHYVIGIKETDLISQLSGDGFKKYLNSGHWYISRRGFPCALEWIVDWKTDENKNLVQINGHYYGTCL